MHVLLSGRIREMPSPTLAPTSTHHVGILNSCAHRPGDRWQCLGPVDAKRLYLAPLPHPVWWTLPPTHQSHPTPVSPLKRGHTETPPGPRLPFSETRPYTHGHGHSATHLHPRDTENSITRTENECGSEKDTGGFFKIISDFKQTHHHHFVFTHVNINSFRQQICTFTWTFI